MAAQDAQPPALILRSNHSPATSVPNLSFILQFLFLSLVPADLNSSASSSLNYGCHNSVLLLKFPKAPVKLKAAKTKLGKDCASDLPGPSRYKDVSDSLQSLCLCRQCSLLGLIIFPQQFHLEVSIHSTLTLFLQFCQIAF